MFLDHRWSMTPLDTISMGRVRFSSWEGTRDEPTAVPSSPLRSEWRVPDRAWVSIRGWLQGLANSVCQVEVWPLDLILQTQA